MHLSRADAAVRKDGTKVLPVEWIDISEYELILGTYKIKVWWS